MRCGCPHCRVRGLMGPVMLIAIGVIFLVAQYTRYSIADLWPVLLIVAGVVMVAQALASKSGHVSS
jgi:uncharacterized membrane protein HdeD (DUF308 family)